MDPVRLYDYLVLARARILEWVRPLSAADYTRTFPVGLGSLAATLTHIYVAEWYYIERLEQRHVPPDSEWPIQAERPPEFAVLERVWTEQAQSTRRSLAAVRDWDASRDYRVVADDGTPTLVSASAADLAAQLVLHEVHHRAQAMNMLRRLGVELADLDFNALMYVRRPA